MGFQGTLGFLGFGNMGRAIAGGLLETGVATPGQLCAYDLAEEARAEARRMGIAVAGSEAELARRSDIIMLAVKPQTMDTALDAIQPALRPDSLVVSIAAGISIGWIQQKLGTDIRVIRVMPNTPALVKTGAAGLAFSPVCTEADKNAARIIFESIGTAEIVAESDIDAVTALSGSGPAYFFYLVECLVNAAKAEGLDEDLATRLAAQTLLGAGKLLSESGESAAVLRQRVTSKGGTTEAALRTFAENGLDKAVAAGVKAAAARSRELGK
ncbi:MAG: pyrroline-5-carboxylate reductase [Candidatus Hydrogenedentota bacterium]